MMPRPATREIQGPSGIRLDRVSRVFLSTASRRIPTRDPQRDAGDGNTHGVGTHPQRGPLCRLLIPLYALYVLIIQSGVLSIGSLDIGTLKVPGSRNFVLFLGPCGFAARIGSLRSRQFPEPSSSTAK